MDIRTAGALPLRRSDLGNGMRAPGAAAPSSSPASLRRAVPPPTPVTVQMLPSHQAGHSVEQGARQGYAAARDALKD
ncbi:hypothetical protein [Salipiger abyssi]|uniref:hypothetical protein n=1 Tax=Salipiger abyssi TaxID=1250539 RepID=UPI00405A21FC